ncbi:exosortase-associated EpsI family protein, partial [Pseudomonas aeruginosa]|uniref:exosortase-associated EpsI family protein n=1 Tax=Pseudomonas aeruginosa TaxID=287 RepID=UPI001F23A57A
QQGYDSKLLGSHHRLLGADEKRWAQLDGRPQSLSLAGQDLELHSVELRAGSLSGVRGQRLRVWQFFWVHGRLTASPVRAKAWNAWQRL